MSWEEYSPPEFTAPHVLEAVWADPDMKADGFNPKWNKIDANVSYNWVLHRTYG